MLSCSETDPNAQYTLLIPNFNWILQEDPEAFDLNGDFYSQLV